MLAAARIFRDMEIPPSGSNDGVRRGSPTHYPVAVVTDDKRHLKTRTGDYRAQDRNISGGMEPRHRLGATLQHISYVNKQLAPGFDSNQRPQR